MQDTLLQTYLTKKQAAPLEVDLDWLVSERQANSYFRRRGHPQRFTFWWVSDDVLEVKMRQHAVAVWVKSAGKLYRVDGSLNLHWQVVRRAIDQHKKRINPKEDGQ